MKNMHKFVGRGFYSISANLRKKANGMKTMKKRQKVGFCLP